MKTSHILTLTYGGVAYKFLVSRFHFGPVDLVKVVDVKLESTGRTLSHPELDALIVANPLMPFELQEITQRIEDNVTVQ